MSLARGDLVYVAAKGPYTSKPRPAVVVQSNAALGLRESVTVCLLTGQLAEAPLARVRIEPSALNGLAKPSDVMADKIITVPAERLPGPAFGRLSVAELRELDRALRFWLDL